MDDDDLGASDCQSPIRSILKWKNLHFKYIIIKTVFLIYKLIDFKINSETSRRERFG